VVEMKMLMRTARKQKLVLLLNSILGARGVLGFLSFFDGVAKDL